MVNFEALTEQEPFTIQELSHESGLSESTLRYYEKIGLIKPVPRDASSGHRRYSAETVRVVSALSCLRTSGLSIEDMRTYLELLEQGVKGAAQQKALFTNHVAELERQIERLQTRKQYIEGKVAYWDAIERGDIEAVQRILEENHRIAAKIK